MFEKIQKKASNILIFLDLAKMRKHYTKDFSPAMRMQEKRLRRLVRKAYKIPFYRERFDKAGVKVRT